MDDVPPFIAPDVYGYTFGITTNSEGVARCNGGQALPEIGHAGGDGLATV